ncbi:MAG: hypothetical protein H7X99_05715, partial [Saprospiraceae bacterium]|nr:hypothetical protein [Saprospiraceae bacterium]
DTDIKSFFYHTGINGIWKNMLANLELPYFEALPLNNAAFHIHNAEPSATAIAGQFTAAEGIGVYGNSNNIGGKFWGGSTGIDVVGGGSGYAANFYGSDGNGVHIDMNGNNLKSLIVERGLTGLGTITPQAKLHLSTDATNGGNIFLSSALFYNPVDEMKLAHWTQQPPLGGPLESYFGMRSNHRLNIVSNNNIANPELSVFNGKVGINKIDGTYPLSMNGKTAFYEDNTFVGEIFGNPITGNLHINGKQLANGEGGLLKHIILQIPDGNQSVGYVGINTFNPSAYLEVGKYSSIYGTAAKFGASKFDIGTNHDTEIVGGDSESGALYLNHSIPRNVHIAAGGGNVYIAPKADVCGHVFISSGDSGAGGTNGGNVFIAQSGGDVMMKNPNTSLSIGTENKDHKLNVNGTIRSTELIVESGWADYVFDEDYKLLPIDEVEKYIISNSHLPNIPTASVIQNEGLKVSEISTKMMEKIEEMMLYIIEQNKQIKLLQKEVSLLKSQK